LPCQARLVPGVGLWRSRHGTFLASACQHLLLPAIVLGVLNSALIIRFTRASLLDILGEDYVRTARAKGLAVSAW
jgi:ABC-type dipeptide/oligopeptide/nickel transport system permease component